MNIKQLINEIPTLTKEQLQVAYQNLLFGIDMLSKELDRKEEYIKELEFKLIHKDQNETT